MRRIKTSKKWLWKNHEREEASEGHAIEGFASHFKVISKVFGAKEKTLWRISPQVVLECNKGHPALP